MSDTAIDTQSPNIHIRAAQAQDHARVKEMMESNQRLDLGLQGDPMREPSEATAIHFKKTLARVENYDGVFLVYEIDGEVVGFIAGYGESIDEPRQQAEFNEYGLITDVFVRQNMRNMGIARALIEAFENEMSQKGYKYVRILAKNRNEGAMQAYAHSGFEAYEQIFVKKLGE